MTTVLTTASTTLATLAVSAATSASTDQAPFAKATLVVTLDCNNATLCQNVPRPAVRGSTQLLLTVFLPIVTTALKTLYMKASRKFWKRAADFLLRLLFPEMGLMRVHKEEVDRSHYLNVLHNMGCTVATRQQLMAIQAGKLHRSRTADCGSPMCSTTSMQRLSQFSPVASLSPSSTPTVFPGAAAIAWCSESPSKDKGHYQVDLADVNAYVGILQSLPTGQKTVKGIGLPDSATLILSLQLIWLLVTISRRLISHYLPSLIELYGLFTLTSFVAERFITQFNAPAWQQHVVFTSSSPWHHSDDDGKRNSWKSVLVIVPLLLFVSWPGYMILYGLKGENPETSLTSSLCVAAGGVYCAGLVWLLIGNGAAESKNGFWRAMRWIPWIIGYGALTLSRVLMIGFGVFQAFYGEREIFLIPHSTWDIPHLSG